MIETEIVWPRTPCPSHFRHIFFPRSTLPLQYPKITLTYLAQAIRVGITLGCRITNVLNRVITNRVLGQKNAIKCLLKIAVFQRALAQCYLCSVCFCTPLDSLGTSLSLVITIKGWWLSRKSFRSWKRTMVKWWRLLMMVGCLEHERSHHIESFCRLCNV